MKMFGTGIGLLISVLGLIALRGVALMFALGWLANNFGIGAALGLWESILGSAIVSLLQLAYGTRVRRGE